MSSISHASFPNYKRTLSDHKINLIRKFSLCLKDSLEFNCDDNNMDSEIIPIQLESITCIEHMLITQVQPAITLHRLRDAQCGFAEYATTFIKTLICV